MSLSDCEKCWETPCRCGHAGYGLIPEEALQTTFCLEYNPNCKKKYMVRICGYRMGRIDKRSIYHDSEKSGDAIGYGTTFEDAFNEAIKRRADQKAAHEETKKLSQDVNG